MGGVTFLGIVSFTGAQPPAAEFRDTARDYTFRLNAKSLKERIRNIKDVGGDVSEEEHALTTLEEDA